MCMHVYIGKWAPERSSTTCYYMDSPRCPCFVVIIFVPIGPGSLGWQLLCVPGSCYAADLQASARGMDQGTFRRAISCAVSCDGDSSLLLTIAYYSTLWHTVGLNIRNLRNLRNLERWLGNLHCFSGGPSCGVHLPKGGADRGISNDGQSRPVLFVSSCLLFLSNTNSQDVSNEKCA